MPKILGWGLTFLFVNLAWVLFRAPSLPRALLLYSKLFAFNFEPAGVNIFLEFLPDLVSRALDIISLASMRGLISQVFTVLYLGLALIMVVGMKNTYQQTLAFKPTARKSVFISLVFVWSVISLTGVNIFIYFNF